MSAPAQVLRRGDAPQLSQAKMAKTFAQAPGLFRVLKNGDRKRLKLDITYKIGDAEFRFTGFEPLDATDLRVLQGLVALATGSLRGKGGGVRTMLRIGGGERSGLGLKYDALTQRTVGVQFRIKPFATALGYVNPGAATLKQIEKSIRRLYAVTVFATRPGYLGGYHIVSGYSENLATGVVSVALNPEMTAAILAKENYLSVRMDEVCKLQSDAARLLHARLHWINQGTSAWVGMEKLLGYVYGGGAGESTDRKLRYYRCNTVKNALGELARIGWKVEPPGSTGLGEVKSYRISRPSGPRSDKFEP